MKYARIALILLLLLVMCLQPVSAQKEKYHSIFIYNFTKYIKWPDNSDAGSFVIGVLGNSPIQKDLSALALNKQVNGKKIEIKEFNSIDDAGDCQILYVSPDESSKISEILAATRDENVLIIANAPGMIQKGAAINFIEVDGKIKFELNQQNVESKGLKVAGSLVSLAILV